MPKKRIESPFHGWSNAKPFFLYYNLILRTFRAKPVKWQGLKSLQPPKASRIFPDTGDY
jgi:hypothetical protein